MLSWTRAISFLLLIYLLVTCASADTTDDTSSTSTSTSTSASTSRSPSSELDTFLAWLNQHGAKLDGIEFVEDWVKGRSVKATKALKKGDLVARLPFRIFFTIEHLSSTDPDLSDLLQDVSDTNAMAIFTADQANRPDSFWAPYLSYLPSDLDTPLTWNDPLLFDALKGTNVVPLMRKRREAVDKRYAALSQVIKDRVSLEDFHWGLAILWSRTFSVKAKSPSGKWESGSAFVPVADMFNTAIPSLLNTDCFTNKESTHFQCSTTKDVEKGEELTAPYSKGLTSGQYLMDYGFVLANNPHHVITVESLPIHPLESEKESTFQTKYQLIRSIKNLRMANESGNPIFQLKDVPSDWINLATSGLPSSLTDILIFTRILSLLDIDVSRYSQSQLTQRLITEKRSLHDASDHRAMTILMNMLSFAQHQYELNDDELDAKLDPKYCVGAWCRVAELRAEDMRLINKYTHMAEEYQKTLNPSADDARFGRSPPPRKQKLDKTKPYNRRDEL